MKGLEDLTPIEEEHTSLQDILLALLDGEENLDLKTRILNPKDLASLKALALVEKAYEWNKSSNLLLQFIDIFLRYNVSWKGLSRHEIITAVTGLLEREQPNITLSERLTSNLKK